MTLTTKKGRFWDALITSVASGSSVKDASEKIGCSVHHAYRLSCQDEFKQAVNSCRSQIASQAVGTLTTAAQRAAQVLLDCLDAKQIDQSEVAAIRLKIAAAKAVLSSLGPVSEQGELRQRLDELEKSR